MPSVRGAMESNKFSTFTYDILRYFNVFALLRRFLWPIFLEDFAVCKNFLARKAYNVE